MGDVFKEQLVKRNSTAKDTAIRLCAGVLVLLVTIAAFMLIPGFAPIVAVAAVFGAMYLTSFLKVEYEYIFTNGELDIDAIYNRSRRKRMFSANVKEFEIMAHVEDPNHSGAFQGTQETLDFSSGSTGPDSYAFITNKNSKRVKVIIQPNEKMLKAISGVMSRAKLHIKR